MLNEVVYKHTHTHTSFFTVTQDELVSHFTFVMTMVKGRLGLNLIIVIFIVMAYGERESTLSIFVTICGLLFYSTGGS